jgi:hypothetical protein
MFAARSMLASSEVMSSRMKKGSCVSFPFESGAGEESRTLDLNLGKVALYQLSYSRFVIALLSSTTEAIL